MTVYIAHVCMSTSRLAYMYESYFKLGLPEILEGTINQSCHITQLHDIDVAVLNLGQHSAPCAESIGSVCTHKAGCPALAT